MVIPEKGDVPVVNLQKMGLGEVIAIFWTINDPSGLYRLKKWLISSPNASFSSWLHSVATFDTVSTNPHPT